jgi:hypothetical protein
MDRSGPRAVRELHDGVSYPTPNHRAIVIAAGRELVGTRGALLKGLLAVVNEHQIGGASDIGFGYHADEIAGLGSMNA